MLRPVTTIYSAELTNEIQCIFSGGAGKIDSPETEKVTSHVPPNDGIPFPK